MWNKLLVLSCFLLPSLAWGGSDKVKLKDVDVLTLRVGQFTAGRRSAGVPQVKCVGGSAGCQAFVPQVVQCYNRGFDGTDFQWECKADMDNAYRFGAISVSCEGYDYPDDPYVLKGSCGLEYALDYTKDGYQQKHSQQYGWNYDSLNSEKPYSKGSSIIETITLFVVVGIVVYAVYKTCIAPREHMDQRSFTNDDHRPDPPRGNNPPPPGFRSDYYPGSGGSGGGGGDSCGASSSRANNAGGGFPAGGFWTGAATGGLLGYMFGNRNNAYDGGYAYQQPYRRSGYDSWGSRTGGGSSFFGGGGAGPSSSGSRSTSGFGGTTRR